VSGEVLSGLSKRRDWSTEEKLRILAQGTAPGSSPSLTCRMHGISSGQFYTWRKQFRSGALTGFMPVSIAQDIPVLLAPAPVPVEAQPAALAAGNVEVELPNGIKLRVTGGADASTLRQILSALQ
jgi:transposase